MRPSGSLEIEGEQKQPQVFEEADPRGDEAAAGRVPHNPWLLRCDRNQLTQLAAGALSSVSGSGSSGGSSSHCSAPPPHSEEPGRRREGGRSAGERSSPAPNRATATQSATN